jgi:hypothetical protein
MLRVSAMESTRKQTAALAGDLVLRMMRKIV